MKRSFALLCVMASMVGHPFVAFAHGVGSREMDPGAARVVEFLYADGEPMAFAQVQVTAPGGAVHQSARADARGRFAFVPTGPGVWSVAASDGQGHRAVAELSQTAAKGEGDAASAGTPGTPGAGSGATRGIGTNGRDVVLGLSLLGNVFLFAAWRRVRRGNRAEVP